MPSLPIENIKMTVKRQEPDVRIQAAIMQDLEDQLKAIEEEKANNPPPVKKQFVMLLSDPTGRITPEFLEASGMGDLVGWVVQIAEDESVHTASQRIIQAAYEFNTSPKGRRMPIETIGEACECVSAKLLKEQQVWIKTKSPVLVIPVANKIPTEPEEEDDEPSDKIVHLDNHKELNDDELYNAAVGIIRETKRASTSTLQRRLRIGYNRAARLMEQMESNGVVGPENGSSPREIL